MPRKVPLAFACVLALAPLEASCRTIEVLWYSYAHRNSIYVQSIQKLADIVHTFPHAAGLRWKLTFFWPDSPVPAFARYNVLVIHSGETSFTAQHFPALGLADPKKDAIPPNFAGILKNKAAIEGARGERTFITGADADVHAINGDTGLAPLDPTGRKGRVTCNPPITGKSCWDGALGHLVNAVNWAGSGRGLGIVSLVAAEHPGSQWWLHPDSFLRAELRGYVTIFGDGEKKRENNPVIPPAAQRFALNSGLTSKGLGNWRFSFHAGISHKLPGYAAVVDSTLHPDTAVAVATARFAGAGWDVSPSTPSAPGQLQR